MRLRNVADGDDVGRRGSQGLPCRGGTGAAVAGAGSPVDLEGRLYMGVLVFGGIPDPFLDRYFERGKGGLHPYS
ncbi:hypothetical protein KDAU_55650 [Dictyobacter aurantiacus]|uniref:Uncharacterized protein n=1 Tax=Dictyobacter aurantiacus TaxID=1936993 RepID=A0A401ZN99_9CHLR|nr:hypothetical protein KDAU_55650 [Dictyobacter aurantiacus]